MASTDALSFPEKGVAHRVSGFIRLWTTGKVAGAGLGTLASSISKDGGAFATGPVPVEIATNTGLFTLDLTAANMSANTVAVKVTSSTSNTEDFVLVLYPLVWSSKAGRGASRFEELMRKSVEYLCNQQIDTGALQQVYCDDGLTVSVSGSVAEGDTSATRGALS